MNDVVIKLAIGGSCLVLALVIRAVSVNTLVRRRLVMSLGLFAVYVAGVASLAWYPFPPDTAVRVLSINQLVFALAVINLFVIILINPIRENRVPERFPAIVQDTIIITVFVVVATGVMQEKFLTTSAVGAVVVGFALQDTLGNMFSGLAIQVEKPFRVGQWVTVGAFEGIVTEVTWRATKLRTKAGNQVVLPNAFISKEPITNYSEPAVPVRLDVIVGVSYDVPPARVKAALLEAVANAPMVLASPEPDVLLDDFAASSVNYRVRFWIDDFSRDNTARDQVRTSIYYALHRHRFEIPFPQQVETIREVVTETPTEHAVRLDADLASVDIFQTLRPELRRELARRSRELLFAPGDAIVRQGDAGDSMFVIADGQARVVEASGRELAVFGEGKYIGEMSMLTGQPRSATVLAAGECRVIELTSTALREVVLDAPDVLDRITEVVAERRADLERQKAEAARVRFELDESKRTLMTRIQAFLRIPERFRA